MELDKIDYHIQKWALDEKHDRPSNLYLVRDKKAPRKNNKGRDFYCPAFNFYCLYYFAIVAKLLYIFGSCIHSYYLVSNIQEN